MSVVELELQDAERLSQAEALLAGIPGAFDKAVRSAMARAVSKMKSESTKALRERYDISAARVRSNQDVRVEYSFHEGASVTVRFMGSKFRLAHFNGSVVGQTHLLDTSKWVHVRHYKTGNWITVQQQPRFPSSTLFPCRWAAIWASLPTPAASRKRSWVPPSLPCWGMKLSRKN